MEIYIVFEYAEHTNKIVGCYKNEEDAKKKHDELAMQIEEIETRGQNLRHFQETLESLNGQVTEFDSTLWGSLVDYITVYENGEKTVTFRDGSVI